MIKKARRLRKTIPERALKELLFFNASEIAVPAGKKSKRVMRAEVRLLVIRITAINMITGNILVKIIILSFKHAMAKKVLDKTMTGTKI